MLKILSIQSHVAEGYVGNRAAVFPLQCLGFDVTAINTVQFSNHTGYKSWQGDVMSADHIRRVIQGLRELKLLSKISAVLTGYMGDLALGEIVLETVAEIRAENPKLIYCCDPVMGDVKPGFFVKETLAKFFKEQALVQADIITPNKFEAEYLTGLQINTVQDAQQAAECLLSMGPRIVLITSLETEESFPDKIQMLVASAQEQYIISTDKFHFDIQPSGSGDLTAALFLAQQLQHKTLAESLDYLANVLHDIYKRTYDANSQELHLIESRNVFNQVKSVFFHKKLK